MSKVIFILLFLTFGTSQDFTKDMTKSYSLNLSFPFNDELNQITLRKDFKLSQNISFSPSIGLILNPINLGFKYEQNYNQNGFIVFSSIGYSPFKSWTHGGKPGMFYHLSPSYRWRSSQYIYINLGINYSIYYDFEEEVLYVPTKMEGESFSGIIPFLQIGIKF